MKHYFLDYTDEALIEVIQRQDEWSKFDTDMAETILKERDIELLEEKLNELKEIRLEELAEPEQPDNWYIPAGYIFCALGSFFGFAIGLFFVNARKKLLLNPYLNSMSRAASMEKPC